MLYTQLVLKLKIHSKLLNQNVDRTEIVTMQYQFLLLHDLYAIWLVFFEFLIFFILISRFFRQVKL